jgi:hypothetical protein
VPPDTTGWPALVGTHSHAGLTDANNGLADFTGVNDTVAAEAPEATAPQPQHPTTTATETDAQNRCIRKRFRAAPKPRSMRPASTSMISGSEPCAEAAGEPTPVQAR